jgi:His/Glu/Gln/Arg/opine family amino acid ABC transporter permease subunit
MTFDLLILKQYYPILLEGVLVTLRVTALSLVFGLMGGLVLCFGKLAGKGSGFVISTAIIDFFRTIPEFVLIFWIYSCLPLLLTVKMPGEASGIVALSLFTAAYTAEIMRAGILSVDRGQLLAALSLGIPKFKIWTRVIFPTAIRRMIPAFISFLTELIKATALLSAVSVAEITYQANILGSRTFAFIEFLSAAAVLYFVIIFPLSMVARRVEHQMLAQGLR